MRSCIRRSEVVSEARGRGKCRNFNGNADGPVDNTGSSLRTTFGTDRISIQETRGAILAFSFLAEDFSQQFVTIEELASTAETYYHDKFD